MHPTGNAQLNLLVYFVLISLPLISEFNQVGSLRTKARSVKNCDTQSSVVPIFGGSSENCKLHCWKTYVSSSGEIVLANRDAFQYELLPPVLVHGSHHMATPEKCCCYYNVPWPKELVKPEYVNRQGDDWGRTHSRTECLPIVLSINLTKRTKDTYNELCRLLAIKRPLTMLELSKFVDSAAYLNYMQPKHPSIWKTLKAREVKKLDMEAADEFRSIYREKLFDVNRPIGEYDGAKLGTHKLVELMNIKKLMPSALKSHVVAQAFDELVISHALVDIAAATYSIQKLNYNELGIPDHLLEGDYDKYDKSSLPYYFALDGLDCKKLRQVHFRLTSYLSTMRALLSSLYEKLVFEVMSEKYNNLIELNNSERIYKKLMDVNCN